MIAIYSANIRKGRRIIASTTGHPDHESAARAVFAMTLEGDCASTWRGVGLDIRFCNRPPVTFEEASARAAELSAACDATGETLQQFPRDGLMGLPTEEVRTSPEFRAARAAWGEAMEALRVFNVGYVKRFPREIRAARDARRQARLDNLARLSPAN